MEAEGAVRLIVRQRGGSGGEGTEDAVGGGGGAGEQGGTEATVTRGSAATVSRPWVFDGGGCRGYSGCSLAE